MADCDMLGTCPFFNDRMAEMTSISAIIKNRYCRGNNRDCARYRVLIACGRDAVPPDLYPSQGERVEGIISSCHQ